MLEGMALILEVDPGRCDQAMCAFASMEQPRNQDFGSRLSTYLRGGSRKGRSETRGSPNTRWECQWMGKHTDFNSSEWHLS